MKMSMKIYVYVTIIKFIYSSLCVMCNVNVSEDFSATCKFLKWYSTNLRICISVYPFILMFEKKSIHFISSKNWLTLKILEIKSIDFEYGSRCFMGFSW